MKEDKLQRLAIIALSISIAVTVIGVMPVAAEVSVTRELPDTPVGPRGDVYVTLNQSGFLWDIGDVKETLPEGFKYVPGSIIGEARFISYDETTNELMIQFKNETTIKYLVEAGTAEQIETAVFSGKYFTTEDLKPIEGDIGGDTTLTLAEPTPTPTVTEAPPSGNGAGGGGGGIPPAPSAGTPAYIDLNATPAEIPADATSTSTITASVWDGEDWMMENLTVNFSTDSGEITASVAIVNGTATGILTAGTEEGIANVTAEANLSGDIGAVSATTTVNFTTPGVTPTATATPEVTVTETPTAVETPAATPTPAGRWGVPGFEGIFAIAGLLAVAYLVKRRRRR